MQRCDNSTINICKTCIKRNSSNFHNKFIVRRDNDNFKYSNSAR